MPLTKIKKYTIANFNGDGAVVVQGGGGIVASGKKEKDKRHNIQRFITQSLLLLSPAFRTKSGGTLFLVFRGAWCVARGAWFRVFSRYFVPLTPPTVFCPILLKLHRCFKDGLKMCMWFFQNPEIIFCYFFHIFNLDIFWVLILQKSIGSRYLVPLTPPTVFGRSFWNFTWAFRMAWRYACGFFRILNNFLSLFSHF